MAHSSSTPCKRVLRAVAALCVFFTVTSVRGQQIAENFVMVNHVEPLPRDATFIVGADIDRDGKTDFLAVGNDFMFFRSKGDGTFFPAVTTQPAVGIGSAAPTGDFDGDGRFDLIGQNDIYLGNGDGTFRTAPNSGALKSIASSFRPINLGANLINAVVADFDEDGKSDIAGADSSSYQVLLSNGGGSFRISFSIPGGSQFASAFTVDMNRDGHADLILQTSRVDQAAVFQVFLGDGRGSFAAGPTVRFPFTALYTLIGDFNGDAIPDFRITSASSYDAFVVLGSPGGSYRDPVKLGYFAFEPKAARDYNLDGFQDLLERGGSVMFISLGRGDGSFLAPVRLHPFGFTAQGDWNGDGRPDLATITGDISILLNKTSLAPGDLPAVLSSADGTLQVAPGSLASLYGAFWAETESASVPSLTLGAIQIRVAGQSAELLYVSSSQINFRIPENVRPGVAVVELLNIFDPQEELMAVGLAQISASAPTVFTCGPGTNTLIATAEADNGLPEPIDVCGNTRFHFPARITFYGTGFVDATTENTRVAVMDQAMKPLYVGPAGGIPGLDKVVIQVDVNPTEDGDAYGSWISITVKGMVVGKGYTPVY